MNCRFEYGLGTNVLTFEVMKNTVFDAKTNILCAKNLKKIKSSHVPTCTRCVHTLLYRVIHIRCYTYVYTCYITNMLNICPSRVRNKNDWVH